MWFWFHFPSPIKLKLRNGPPSLLALIDNHSTVGQTWGEREDCSEGSADGNPWLSE